jgi:hypothetical protein
MEMRWAIWGRRTSIRERTSMIAVRGSMIAMRGSMIATRETMRTTLTSIRTVYYTTTVLSLSLSWAECVSDIRKVPISSFRYVRKALLFFSAHGGPWVQEAEPFVAIKDDISGRFRKDRPVFESKDLVKARHSGKEYPQLQIVHAKYFDKT